jgi:DNA-binding phage protein
MNLQELRDAASACTHWRDRLNDDAYLAEVAKLITTQHENVAAEVASGQGVHSYSFCLWSEGSRSHPPSWSFDVVHRVDRDGQKTTADLRLRWVFERRARPGTTPEPDSGDSQPDVAALCLVEGTWLSFADELYRSLGGKLTTDQAGEMFLSESGLPFDLFVHSPLKQRRVRTLLAPFVRPLVIVGPRTTEEELLAQLCIFALQTEGLIDNQGEALEQLQRWLAQLARTRRLLHDGPNPHVVTVAAEHLLTHWSRPMSPGSFRDYCHRTLSGLVREERRQQGHHLVLDDRRDRADDQAHGHDENMQRGGRRTAAVSGRGGIDEAIGVSELARVSGLPRRTVYRWLRVGRIAGGVETFTTASETALGLRLERTHRRYTANGAMVAEAEGLLEQRSLRRDLIKVVASRRSIGIRGARALVARRIKQGKTIQEVAQELLGAPN